jgi:hypothetical protein
MQYSNKKNRARIELLSKKNFGIEIIIRVLFTVAKRHIPKDTIMNSQNSCLRYLLSFKNRDHEFTMKNHIIKGINLRKEEDNTWTVTSRWFTQTPAIYLKNYSEIIKKFTYTYTSTTNIQR